MVRFVTLVLISALASPALGQSLGELAKKEKERRKKIKEEGAKVLVLTGMRKCELIVAQALR